MESILESSVKIALNNLIIVAEEYLEEYKTLRKMSGTLEFTTDDDEQLRESIKLVKAYRDKAIYKTTEPIFPLEEDVEEMLKKEGFEEVK